MRNWWPHDRLCSASSGWRAVPEHHTPLWQQVSQVEHRLLSAYEELVVMHELEVPAESPENGASELSR